ncbi:MAG: orotate phosphoribosyltransferase [Candidatus Saccharimonadales bacterium]
MTPGPFGCNSGGMTRDELARRIADVALLRGEFTLRSGRKSNYYLDKSLFETQPDILKALGGLFAQRVGQNVDRIAGAELGAVALAAATAMACGKPFVIIRNQKKDYGTSKLVEGALKTGETVTIVEDVLTTGGQVIEAARTLKDAGAKVERIVAVIDRLEGARANIEAAGYSFESLFTTKDLGIV